VLVVCLGAGALGVAAGLASSGQAAAYRNHVNGLCRSYTPTLKKIQADALAAKKAGNRRRISYDLGLSLVLRLLKTIDGYLHRFFASVKAGDQTLAIVELQHISTLARPLNSMLDSAGLRDCGSNQT